MWQPAEVMTRRHVLAPAGSPEAAVLPGAEHGGDGAAAAGDPAGLADGRRRPAQDKPGTGPAARPESGRPRHHVRDWERGRVY